MAGLSNTYENRMLDACLGSAHGADWPATVHVCLFTVIPADDGTGGTEVVGGGYARVALANTDANWPDAVSGVKSNGVVVTFPEATAAWGTVVAWGLADHASNAISGTLICAAPLGTPVPVNLGETPSFAIGALPISGD